MIKIAITDDHPLLLEGLKNIINAHEDFEVVGMYASAEDLFKNIVADAPHVLLLDINLPDANGIDLVKGLKEAYPEMRIVAFSVHNELAVINSILSEGADAYLQKNATGAEIIAAIADVLVGKRYICTKTQAILNKKTDAGLKQVPKLTRREKEILTFVAKGMTTNQIADSLFISSHTVESHRKNLMEKFQTKSVTAAVKSAIEYGLIREL
ncbi:MAG: DNA-binding response regulator [Sphingobacterium sp.]|jgi:DNA-binding NarL/FixJ family response regulator|uniref:response regulator n=1 Tax=unclassified Sphingobacterium TaxID=2609468 RepID=UPI0009860318|nr:response regulator transcription factor [Sphingobacterium sp. CZ-UAM]MDF2516413.1 DNA-binding response regulator [Sphingobacterium sp.]OOG19592.1 DNA-binding response regulator [Sphingobacterium sp. CZ-UAM]